MLAYLVTPFSIFSVRSNFGIKKLLKFNLGPFLKR